MKFQIKYDTLKVCRVVIQEQLEKLGIPFVFDSLGELEITKNLSTAENQLLLQALYRYGIEIIDDPRNIFVQKVKNLIIEMIQADSGLPSAKFSDYLAQKLNHSYGHISKIFSEVTYTSLENFIILQKIEMAKQMIKSGELTLTEMAWKLNYSSVQHLSNQFKKTTGITPTSFQRIVKERRKKMEKEDM